MTAQGSCPEPHCSSGCGSRLGDRTGSYFRDFGLGLEEKGKEKKQLRDLGQRMVLHPKYIQGSQCTCVWQGQVRVRVCEEGRKPED